MKLSTDRKQLISLLARCQSVADRKSTMPMLGNVLVSAEKGSVRVSATDLAVSVSGAIPAEVTKPGTVALDARSLLERVRMMPDGAVSLSIEKGSAVLKASGSARRYTLHTAPGEDFPRLPVAPDDAQWRTISVERLARLIATTQFAISPDDTRAHMNGALLEWHEDHARMVATDGHRISVCDVANGDGQADAALIPAKGIAAIKRLCDESSGNIRLARSGADLHVESESGGISVRLADAAFPPYKQVIPERSDRVVLVQRLATADALRAVSVAASDRTGGVKVTLKSGVVRFESESPETGAGCDEVAAQYGGAEMTIGVCARYLLDALGAIETEEVELGFGGDLDPVVVRPSGAGGYLAVVMPMRV